MYEIENYEGKNRRHNNDRVEKLLHLKYDLNWGVYLRPLSSIQNAGAAQKSDFMNVGFNTTQIRKIQKIQ